MRERELSVVARVSKEHSQDSAMDLVLESAMNRLKMGRTGRGSVRRVTQVDWNSVLRLKDLELAVLNTTAVPSDTDFAMYETSVKGMWGRHPDAVSENVRGKRRQYDRDAIRPAEDPMEIDTPVKDASQNLQTPPKRLEETYLPNNLRPEFPSHTDDALDSTIDVIAEHISLSEEDNNESSPDCSCQWVSASIRGQLFSTQRFWEEASEPF